MPNRILREGILTSQRVNTLTAEEEVFYRRLMSVVDDYGRAEAHHALLRAQMYPLRLGKVSEAAIGRLLIKTEEALLIRTYQSAGKHYLEILNFRQQVRGKSKHPEPTESGPRSTCEADAAQTPSTGTAGDDHPKADAHLGVCVSVGVSGGEGGGGPAAGKRSKVVSKPKDAKELHEYAQTLGMSEGEADKFHDHFEANGWRQGGRTPLCDWKAALRNWARRSADFIGQGRKKTSGGGGAPDLSLPNAHTGGLPVFNDGAPAAAAGGES